MHVQVPYRTRLGIQTEVDEGMAHILNLLALLGLETLYSCENGEVSKQAYVLFKWRGSKRFFRTLGRMVKNRQFGSRETQAFAKALLGYSQLELTHYFTRGRFEHEVVKLRLDHGRRRGCDIERSYSIKYGARICMRWPAKANHLMEEVLTLMCKDQGVL